MYIYPQPCVHAAPIIFYLHIYLYIAQGNLAWPLGSRSVLWCVFKTIWLIISWTSKLPTIVLVFFDNCWCLCCFDCVHNNLELMKYLRCCTLVRFAVRHSHTCVATMRGLWFPFQPRRTFTAVIHTSRVSVDRSMPITPSKWSCTEKQGRSWLRILLALPGG